MDKRMDKYQKKFRQRLQQDEILSAYDRTARDLEPEFERLAAALGEEEGRVLLGYADSLKLGRLRLQSLAEECLKEVE